MFNKKHSQSSQTTVITRSLLLCDSDDDVDVQKYGHYCIHTLLFFGIVPEKLLFQRDSPLYFEKTINWSFKKWNWYHISTVSWTYALCTCLLVSRKQQKHAEYQMKDIHLSFLHHLSTYDFTSNDIEMRGIEYCMVWQYLHTVKVLMCNITWDESSFLEVLYKKSEEVWTKYQRRRKQVSAAQQEVNMALKRMGYSTILETLVNGISVDILVPALHVVVEVDGKYHYARNDCSVVLGNTLWKKQVLLHQGWSVVNVSVEEEWEGVDLTKRRKFLNDKLGIFNE